MLAGNKFHENSPITIFRYSANKHTNMDQNNTSTSLRWRQKHSSIAQQVHNLQKLTKPRGICQTIIIC